MTPYNPALYAAHAINAYQQNMQSVKQAALLNQFNAQRQQQQMSNTAQTNAKEVTIMDFLKYLEARGLDSLWYERIKATAEHSVGLDQSIQDEAIPMILEMSLPANEVQRKACKIVAESVTGTLFAGLKEPSGAPERIFANLLEERETDRFSTPPRVLEVGDVAIGGGRAERLNFIEQLAEKALFGDTKTVLVERKREDGSYEWHFEERQK